MRVARIVVTFAFALIPIAASASSFDTRANNLAGYWLFKDKAAQDAVVLRIASVKFVRAEDAEVVAYFGPASGRWGEVERIEVRRQGEHARLDLQSDGYPKVSLQTSEDGTLAGIARTRDSREFPLRLERVAREELYRWVAENPPPALRAGRSSQIDLLYFSAADCPYCRSWEGAYLGNNGKLVRSAEWAAITLFDVQRASYRGRADVDNVPPHLKPAFVKLKEEKHRLFFLGTPAFAVFVDGRLRASAFGANDFDNVIFPVVKAAAREKATPPLSSKD